MTESEKRAHLTNDVVVCLRNFDIIENEIEVSYIKPFMYITAGIKESAFVPPLKVYITICFRMKNITISIPIYEKCNYIYKIMIADYLNTVNTGTTNSGKFVLKENNTVYYECEYLFKDENHKFSGVNFCYMIEVAIEQLNYNYRSIAEINNGNITRLEKKSFLNDIKCLLKNLRV